MVRFKYGVYMCLLFEKSLDRLGSKWLDLSNATLGTFVRVSLQQGEVMISTCLAQWSLSLPIALSLSMAKRHLFRDPNGSKKKPQSLLRKKRPPDVVSEWHEKRHKACNVLLHRSPMLKRHEEAPLHQIVYLKFCPKSARHCSKRALRNRHRRDLYASYDPPKRSK